jgi:hypothetical protein
MVVPHAAVQAPDTQPRHLGEHEAVEGCADAGASLALHDEDVGEICLARVHRPDIADARLSGLPDPAERHEFSPPPGTEAMAPGTLIKRLLADAWVGGAVDVDHCARPEAHAGKYRLRQSPSGLHSEDLVPGVVAGDATDERLEPLS